MLVSYNWLKDFPDSDEDPKDLGEKITRTGVETASVDHPTESLKKLVVDHILECEDIGGIHSHKCQVDVGEDEPIQVVCGAPNVAAGEDVIVALHGVRTAGNEKIKRGKIRGIKSNGTIRGFQEIGSADKTAPQKYVDGTFTSPRDSDVKPSEEVHEAPSMDDYILDFDITLSRADILPMKGAAYEVGTIVDRKLRVESVVLKADGPEWTNELDVKIDEKLALKFYLRKASNAKIGRSPLWMQRHLWNAGLRPVNNVVDVINYVILLTGRPLHVYDARTFKDGKLEVRKVKKGEKLTLLNDKEVDLDPNDIIITDGQKTAMMAGVMGGKNSEVKDDTTDVILESAISSGTSIRKSVLRHANRIEAPSRFEKGVNWDNTQKVLDIAALLLRNDVNGTVNEGEVKAADVQRNSPVVRTTVSYISKVLGTELSRSEMEKVFNRLGLIINGSKDELVVTVPNRRWDISIPADLVEEVSRIYGYDNLKSTQPLSTEIHGGYSEKETAMRRVKDTVQGQGMMKVTLYLLTSLERATSLIKDPKPAVEVQWPLNSSRLAMRENLLTGLVDVASYNMARKQEELALFEQGRVYDYENNTFNEHEHSVAPYPGHTVSANWRHLGRKIDFYFVKGQLTNLLRATGVKDTDIEYRPEIIVGMHPTRTVGIYFNDQYVDLIGMIAHTVATFDKALHGSEIHGYEIDLDTTVSMLHKGVKVKVALELPAIERDLSLLVPNVVINARIEAQIKLNGGKYLHDIQIIDVYAGSQIEAGHKSISYLLTFLNEKDMLTDEVITKAMEKIEADLKESLKIKVR